MQFPSCTRRQLAPPSTPGGSPEIGSRNRACSERNALDWIFNERSSFGNWKARRARRLGHLWENRLDQTVADDVHRFMENMVTLCIHVRVGIENHATDSCGFQGGLLRPQPLSKGSIRYAIIAVLIGDFEHEPRPPLNAFVVSRTSFLPG